MRDLFFVGFVLALLGLGLRRPFMFVLVYAYVDIVAPQRLSYSAPTIDGDEDVIGDGIAFAGVAKYPARVKCALLGWMAFKAALAEAMPQDQIEAQASEETPDERYRSAQ